MYTCGEGHVEADLFKFKTRRLLPEFCPDFPTSCPSALSPSTTTPPLRPTSWASGKVSQQVYGWRVPKRRGSYLRGNHPVADRVVKTCNLFQRLGLLGKLFGQVCCLVDFCRHHKSQNAEHSHLVEKADESRTIAHLVEISEKNADQTMSCYSLSY